MRVVAVAGIALLVSTAVFAQDAVVAQQQKQQQEQAAATLKKEMAAAQARVPIENPIKGAPYSADVIVETSQTLADGNHISNQETSHVDRDSQGRTRREQSAALTTLSRTQPVMSTTRTVISIVDPIAGYAYSLDPEHKIAWRTSLTTGAALEADMAKLKMEMETKQQAEAKAQGAQGGSDRVETAGGSEPKGGWVAVRESTGSAGPLQHKVIDGLPVDGRVNTKVIPAGAIGNDLPITVTSEEWTSPDLHVLVMTHHSDPRTGDTTYRLSNIVRAEPDPSIFLVPQDYTIKDTGIRRNEQR